MAFHIIRMKEKQIGTVVQGITILWSMKSFVGIWFNEAQGPV